MWPCMLIIFSRRILHDQNSTGVLTVDNSSIVPSTGSHVFHTLAPSTTRLSKRCATRTSTMQNVNFRPLIMCRGRMLKQKIYNRSSTIIILLLQTLEHSSTEYPPPSYIISSTSPLIKFLSFMHLPSSYTSPYLIPHFLHPFMLGSSVSLNQFSHDCTQIK